MYRKKQVERITIRAAVSAKVSKEFSRASMGYLFVGGTTASLNGFANRNFTTVLAGILIGAPV